MGGVRRGKEVRGGEIGRDRKVEGEGRKVKALGSNGKGKRGGRVGGYE